jgi:sigma-B regulation protein RsbU (phosphoserine phosphatase)
MKKICFTISSIIFILLSVSPVFSMTLSGWQYAPGHPDDTPADAAIYHYENIHELTQLNRRLPDGRGFIWLKCTFILPSDLKDENVVFLPGRISIADQTFCNSTLIGEGGSFPDETGGFFSDWNHFRFYPIAHEILSAGTNTIRIKMYLNGEGGIQGTPVIIPKKEAAVRAFRENLWTTGINFVLAAILLFAFVYHFLIFLYRRSERDNLYYALLCFFFSFYLSNFFIASLLPGRFGISYLVYQKMIFISMYFIALANFFFLRSFLRIPCSSAVTALMILSASIPSIGILVIGDYGTFVRYAGDTLLFLIPSIAYSIFYLIKSVLRRSGNAISLFVGTLPLWLCIVYDVIVHIFFKLENSVYTAGFGFSIFLITMAVIIARNFVMYHRQVENYSISLEQMVKDRTKDLDDRNKDLEAAHTIMKKDLHIAANLQKSFFSNAETVIPGWEIAAFTRAASSVSGDFFDICTTDSSTTVSLFDVSGHGIASGLITMIAKRTVFRMLKKYSALRLGEIVEKINTSLIEDIGTSGFYLTGVLLRTSAQGIEYVNAGHTEILYRSSKTGAVRLVMAQGGEHKGNFLGIEGMAAPYRAITLRMNEGDFLVLYTDCLIETVNGEGKMFVIDDLISATEYGNAQNAEDLLKTILSRFSVFCGGTPEDRGASLPALKDDLSIIVLRKKP